MSCADFGAAMAAIDFEKLDDVYGQGFPEASQSAAHEVIAPLGDAGYRVSGGVATIDVRGLLVPDLGYDLACWGITGYDVIAKYVENANEDSSVERIVLDIDSGGGFVQGLASCVDTIQGSEKPVETYASGTMASAAYWLGASPSGTVACSSESRVGSIGVYIEHFDRSSQLEEEGIVSRVFKSGFWKGAFSSYRPLSEREQERLQAEVDESADSFFEFVADQRGVAKARIRSLDGDIFGAERSLELQLVDSIRETAMSTTTTGAAKAPAGTASSDASSASSSEGSAPAPLTAEQQASVDAQIAQALEADRAARADEAQQAADAAAARATAITGHANGSKQMKELLGSAKFASVDTDDIVALLDLSGKTFTAAMEEDGGAGVEGDQKELAPTGSKAKAKKASEDAAAAMASRATEGKKGVL